MMFIKVMFVGLIVAVEFSSTSRVGKWLPLNSKRSLLRDLMYPHRKHALKHRGIGLFANAEFVIGSTSGTIGQDEQDCLRDHHVTIWNAESQAGTLYKRICQQNRSIPSASSPTDMDFDPTIKTSEADQHSLVIMEGWQLTLQCNVNASSIFKWERTKPILKHLVLAEQVGADSNGSTLRNNQIDITINNYKNVSELTINHMTSDDSGTYLCEARRLDQQLIRKILFEIHVLVAPTITDIKVNNLSMARDEQIVYNEMDQLIVTCQAKGSPKPNVFWMRSTGTLDNKQTKTNSPVLSFPNLARHHDGAYICTARNEAGSVQRTMRLSIQYKPVINAGEQDIRRRLDEDVVLRCNAHGNPTPNRTEWFKGPKQIIDENKFLMTDKSLRVLIKSTDDYGNYTCQVSNTLGVTRVMYTVSGRPRIPRIISSNVTKKRSEYHLQWKLNVDRFVDVSHFVVYVYQTKQVDSQVIADVLVQSIQVPVISRTKNHYALHIQALMALTIYEIHVQPYDGRIAGDIAVIIIQTPSEDAVTPVVTVSCSATATQLKARQQKQVSLGSGTGSSFLNPLLAVSVIVIGVALTIV